MLGFGRSRAVPQSVDPHSSVRQVGCFGKLPVQAEYIKHNVAHREVRALDQWLQHGVGLAARNGELQEAAVPEDVYQGVFAGTEEDRPILLSIRASTDQIGRRYPFVVFELPGVRERDTSAGSLPLCSVAFFQGATAVMNLPWHREPLSTVTAWVDDIAAVPRVPVRSGLGDLGAAKLIDQLYPDVAPQRRVPHLKQTVELLRQVERRTAPRVHWGVRLPLATPEPVLAIGWWLRLAESVLGRSSWRPCYFWRASEEPERKPGELLLFFRLPPAQIVMHLLRGHGLQGTVVDPFAELGTEAAAFLPEHGASTTQSLIAWLTGGSCR